ncbi:MAG: hypothetical protein RLY17_1775 [Pseudomonadota bacterium]|jgi:hypothetical protein
MTCLMTSLLTAILWRTSESSSCVAIKPVLADTSVILK